MSNDSIATAKARSIRARAQLTDALTALKQRLLPRTIARNLVQDMTDKSGEAAKFGGDAVKAHPGVTIGVAALAALFFARKPIIRAISSADDETANPTVRSPD